MVSSKRQKWLKFDFLSSGKMQEEIASTELISWGFLGAQAQFSVKDEIHSNRTFSLLHIMQCTGFIVK